MVLSAILNWQRHRETKIEIDGTAKVIFLVPTHVLSPFLLNQSWLSFARCDGSKIFIRFGSPRTIERSHIQGGLNFSKRQINCAWRALLLFSWRRRYSQIEVEFSAGKKTTKKKIIFVTHKRRSLIKAAFSRVSSLLFADYSHRRWTNEHPAYSSVYRAAPGPAISFMVLWNWMWRGCEWILLAVTALIGKEKVIIVPHARVLKLNGFSLCDLQNGP